MWVQSAITGLLAGTFGGLIGIGGGVIMIPLMVGWLHLTQHKAHGTSLVAVVFTGLIGAASYALQGSVDLLAAVVLAATAMFTARAGARFANVIPEWKLKRAFGWFLLFMCIMLLLKPYIGHGSTGSWTAIPILIVAGALTGFLSGMMGVGGGTIMVPAMVLGVGLDQHLAQGTSLLAMVPASAVGAYTHRSLGNLVNKLLPGLVAGVIVGSYLGSTFAHLLPAPTLRILFVLVMAYNAQRYVRARVPQAAA